MTKKRTGLSAESREAILLRSGRRCALCFQTGDGQPKIGHLTHVTGGEGKDTSERDNVVFLCATHHAQLDRDAHQVVPPHDLLAARDELYQVMARGVFCAQCGELLRDLPSTHPEERNPCPKCGAKARSFSVTASDTIGVTDKVTKGPSTGPGALLNTAGEMIVLGQFDSAVLTAFLACEVAAQRAFDAAKSTHSTKPSRPKAKANTTEAKLAGDFDILSARHRRVYEQLTGDELERELFWPAFKSIWATRNAIVHGQRRATWEEAAEAVRAATDLIRHLRQW